MDIKRAIFSHMAWIGDFKHRLGRGETIAAEDAGQTDRCEIGRWFIEHEGDLGGMAEYKAARDTHDQFHACVRDALLEAEKGDSDGAMKLLDESGLCVGISRDLMERLDALFSRTDDG